MRDTITDTPGIKIVTYLALATIAFFVLTFRLVAGSSAVQSSSSMTPLEMKKDFTLTLHINKTDKYIQTRSCRSAIRL
jgi:hypothetical protein